MKLGHAAERKNLDSSIVLCDIAIHTRSKITSLLFAKSNDLFLSAVEFTFKIVSNKNQLFSGFCIL